MKRTVISSPQWVFSLSEISSIGDRFSSHSKKNAEDIAQLQSMSEICGPVDFCSCVFNTNKKKTDKKAKQKGAEDRPSLEDVLEVVCDELNLDKQLLLAKTSISPTVRGRRFVAWIWCEQMGKKQVDVAALFRVRHHAVSYWLKTTRAKEMTPEDLKIVQQIQARLLAIESINKDTIPQTGTLAQAATV